MKWYLLPTSQAKIYLLFMQNVQQPQILYVAGIKPLNMEICVSVSKIQLIRNHINCSAIFPNTIIKAIVRFRLLKRCIHLR